MNVLSKCVIQFREYRVAIKADAFVNRSRWKVIQYIAHKYIIQMKLKYLSQYDKMYKELKKRYHILH